MTLSLRPLAPHVGVEVSGLDLRSSLDDAAAAQLQAAFHEHHFLLIRQQGLGEEDQIRFSRVFGRLLVRNSYDGALGKEAWYISNNRPDGALPTGEIEFHHDHLFYPEPLKAGFLYAIEVPKSGSATRFRNVSALVDRLSPALRVKSEGVRCLHYFNYDDNYSGKQDPTKLSPRAQRAWHPLVWRNPETGRSALWVVRISTVDFEGIARAGGEALIEELWQFAEGCADLAYTHEWQTGDLVVWDNRMLAHARLPFQSSEPRTLRRTSVI